MAKPDSSWPERKLYIGIPKGSLNRPEPNRGNTKLLLETAGWKLRGYEHRHEEAFPEIIEGDKEVKFIVMKPKNFPLYLFEGWLDSAIYGRDIQEEWCSIIWQRFMRNSFESLFESEKREELWEGLYRVLEETEKGNSRILPNKICDLGYGRVDVCFASKKERGNLPLFKDFFKMAVSYLRYYPGGMRCVTDYPNLAYREFSKYFPTRMLRVIRPPEVFETHPHQFLFYQPLMTFEEEINKYIKDEKIKDRIKQKTYTNYYRKINIFPLSLSEASIPLFFGDMVLDCVSSGKSLEDYDLEKLGDPVIKGSVAGLYTNSTMMDRPAHLSYYESSLSDVSIPSKFYTSENEPQTYVDAIEWKREKIQEVAEKLQQAAKQLGWI